MISRATARSPGVVRFPTSAVSMQTLTRFAGGGSLPRKALDRPDRRRRVLQLRVVPERRQPGQRRVRPERQHRLQDGFGADRVAAGPGELEPPGPLPQRAVPARPVGAALVQVEDQPVQDPVPVVIGEQRPLVLGFLASQWMRRGEDPPERRAEATLVREPCGDRPEPAAQQLLPEGETGALQHHAPVEQQHAVEREREPSLEVAGQQLGGDRRPHVVGDQDHRLIGAVAGDDLLDQVGLREQRVQVVPRLIREAEPEEVEREHPPRRKQLEGMPPVVRARRVAVEQQDRRTLAKLRTDENPPAPHLHELTGLPPRLDPGGEAHSRISVQAISRESASAAARWAWIARYSGLLVISRKAFREGYWATKTASHSPSSGPMTDSVTGPPNSTRPPTPARNGWTASA